MSIAGGVVLGVGALLFLVVFIFALVERDGRYGGNVAATLSVAQSARGVADKARKDAADARDAAKNKIDQLKKATDEASAAAMAATGKTGEEKTALDKAKAEKDAALVKALAEKDKANDNAGNAGAAAAIAEAQAGAAEGQAAQPSRWTSHQAELVTIAYLFTMIGLLLLFPGLLATGTVTKDGTTEVSAMRFAVLMVVMLFVVITFKAGWSVGLAELKIDSTWAWILGIAFGGKVAQSVTVGVLSGAGGVVNRGGGGGGGLEPAEERPIGRPRTLLGAGLQHA